MHPKIGWSTVKLRTIRHSQYQYSSQNKKRKKYNHHKKIKVMKSSLNQFNSLRTLLLIGTLFVKVLFQISSQTKRMTKLICKMKTPHQDISLFKSRNFHVFNNRNIGFRKVWILRSSSLAVNGIIVISVTSSFIEAILFIFNEVG